MSYELQTTNGKATYTPTQLELFLDSIAKKVEISPAQLITTPYSEHPNSDLVTFELVRTTKDFERITEELKDTTLAQRVKEGPHIHYSRKTEPRSKEILEHKELLRRLFVGEPTLETATILTYDARMDITFRTRMARTIQTSSLRTLRASNALRAEEIDEQVEYDNNNRQRIIFKINKHSTKSTREANACAINYALKFLRE